MRTRSIPAMFRTGGRLLRWHRRDEERTGKSVNPGLTLDQARETVRAVKLVARRGHLVVRWLSVRDYVHAQRMRDAVTILLQHREDTDQTDEECVGKLVEIGIREAHARRLVSHA